MSYTKAAALLGKGPSRPTLFSVRLPDSFISREVNDYIEFFCTTTAIPEVRLNTVAVAGHENMGIVREQATALIYAKPFNITIIGDPEYKVYKEIRAWFDRTTSGANQLGLLRTQKMRYYDTYAKQMDLVKLEQPELQGEELVEAMKVSFHNAYPVGIGNVTLDTTSPDTFTTFQVSFTYESYSLSYGDNIVNSITSRIS